MGTISLLCFVNLLTKRGIHEWICFLKKPNSNDNQYNSQQCRMNKLNLLVGAWIFILYLLKSPFVKVF
jgi:hypothetical protein